MKQQIKCPHCSKSFPIQEGFKHQAEELRKKLETEEKQKSAIRQKEIEEAYKAKVLKQDQEHQAQLTKMKEDASMKQKKEAEAVLNEINKIGFLNFLTNKEINFASVKVD